MSCVREKKGLFTNQTQKKNSCVHPIVPWQQKLPSICHQQNYYLFYIFANTWNIHKRWSIDITMCVFVSSFSLYNELGSSWRREFVWKTIFIDFLSFFFHQRKKNFFGDSNIWAFFLLYPALLSQAVCTWKANLYMERQTYLEEEN